MMLLKVYFYAFLYSFSIVISKIIFLIHQYFIYHIHYTQFNNFNFIKHFPSFFTILSCILFFIIFSYLHFLLKIYVVVNNYLFKYLFLKIYISPKLIF